MNAVVQRLTEAQKPEMLRHLMALAGEDLRLRFGRSMDERALRAYVDGIDFENDRLFGIYGTDFRLIGMAHLAVNRETSWAELGLSVAPASRRLGVGETLLRRAARHASDVGVRIIYMHCLRENEAMMRLAAKAGFKVVPEGIEANATKALAPASAASLLHSIWYEQVALVDYALKRQFDNFRRSLLLPTSNKPRTADA